jgi:hypothetical protein
MSKLRKIENTGKIHFAFTNDRKWIEKQLKIKLENFYNSDPEIRDSLITTFHTNITDKHWNTLKHRYLRGREKVFTDFGDVSKPLRGRPKKGKNPDGSTKKAGVVPRPSRADFSNHFVKAWKARYARYISEYKKKDSGYRDRDWYKLKKRAVKKNKAIIAQDKKRPGRKPKKPRALPTMKAGHNGRSFKHSSEGLATGYLRESVEKAFKTGTKSHLKVPNPMVSRWVNPGKNFDFNYDDPSYRAIRGKNKKSGYPRYFQSRLRGMDILSNGEKLVDIDDKDWEGMANLMLDFYKKSYEAGDMEEVYEIFSIYGIKVN